MRATLTTHSHLQFNTLSLREVTVTLQQQQTPGIFRQMFQKTTKTLARIATRSLRNSRWKSPGLPT